MLKIQQYFCSPLYAVSSGNYVAVINQGASTVEAVIVGESDHPRELVHTRHLPAHYPATIIFDATFCRRTEISQYEYLDDY